VAQNGRDGAGEVGPGVLAKRYFDTGALHGGNHRRDGAGPDGVPRTVSLRENLRRGLPAIYHDGDFGLRWVAALEMLLDRIVALLDNLPHHLKPELAPSDFIQLMAAWLGVELDEAWPEDRWRELVRHGTDLARMRGTKAGLELELEIAFPDAPLRVEDEGGVFTALDESGLPPVKDHAGFIVYCDEPLSEADAGALARSIEHMKPVTVNYRLRIKAPKKTAT
jgi:phage tail-like protein